MRRSRHTSHPPDDVMRTGKRTLSIPLHTATMFLPVWSAPRFSIGIWHFPDEQKLIEACCRKSREIVERILWENPQLYKQKRQEKLLLIKRILLSNRYQQFF